MGPTAPGTMTKPGLAGSSIAVAFNTNPRLPLDTGRAPSADTSSTVNSPPTASLPATRTSYGRDDVERIEAVEQHQLRMHAAIVSVDQRCTASGQNATFRRNLATAATVPSCTPSPCSPCPTPSPSTSPRRSRCSAGSSWRRARPGYRVLVCGTDPVVTAGALRIGTDHGLDALAAADTIVVPGRNDVTARRRPR